MARHAWWLAAESATALYPAELADYRQDHPAPTLRAYMLATAGQSR